MNPDALYYQDSHLRRFSAQVTGCQPAQGGFAVTLDRTAFYPEGGGQAFDQGTLNGVRVLEVRERDGAVVHLCAAPLDPGQTVAGEIDWPRRFDLMQQHTGEHILSGLIHRRFGFHNVGFHMGADAVTIDFDGVIPLDALPDLEAQVNGAIWRDLPVRAWFPAPEALSCLPYRSKRPLSGLVRLVEVPDYDLCACCGTHVARTGEIGLFKLLSWVKFHQGVRMEMVCGGRALSYLSRIYEQNRTVSQTFSAKPLETGAAALRMQQELANAKARAGGLEARVFAFLAERCRGQKDVTLFEPDLEPEGVRRLADAVAAVCSGRCTVLSGADGAGYRYAIAQPGGDLRAFVQAWNQALRGRGGGKPAFVQGSVAASRAEIAAFLADFQSNCENASHANECGA